MRKHLILETQISRQNRDNYKIEKKIVLALDFFVMKIKKHFRSMFQNLVLIDMLISEEDFSENRFS